MLKMRTKLAAVVLGMGLMGGVMWGDGTGTRPGGAAAGRAPFTISKETTGITGPLRADGAVDYVAALNEKYGKGVTAENNGYVVWLKVVGAGKTVIVPSALPKTLEMLGTKEDAAGSDFFVPFETYLKEVKGMDERGVETASDEIGKACRELWETGEHPEVEAYLAREEKHLKLAEEAAGRPRWWIPYVGDSMIALMLPSLGVMRGAGTAWCARACSRAQSRDFEGFSSDVRAARRLARMSAEGLR